MAVNSSALASYMSAFPQQNVIYLSTDGHVHALSNISGAPWQDSDLTALTSAPGVLAGSDALTAYARPLSGQTVPEQHIAYIDSSNHVHQLWADSQGAWHHQDLTALTGAPSPLVGSPLTSCMRQQPNETQSEQHVSYIDSSGHVHDTWCDSSGTWSDSDLTTASGAPRPLRASPMCGWSFTASAGNTVGLNVAYVDATGHLRLLWTDSSGAWQSQDLTTAAGVSPPLSGSPIGAVVRALDNQGSADQHVFWIDANNHLHATSGSGGQTWTDFDVTNTQGPASAATPGSALATYSRPLASQQQSEIHAILVDVGGHVRELWQPQSDSSWFQRDLTGVTGATGPTAGTALTTYVRPVQNQASEQHVICVDTNTHVHELWCDPQGVWHDHDLTAASS